MALFKSFAVLLLVAIVHGVPNFDTNLDKFNGHFYKESLKQTKSENSIVSALSADIVMSMVEFGATGDTKEEIRQSLFQKNDESTSAHIGKLIDELNSAENVELKLANTIYVAPSPTGRLDSIVPVYKTRLLDVFKSDIKQVDFSKNVATAKEINQWVEDKTNHRIKDLIDENSLNGLTKAVLVNALYFKGNWQKQFDEKITRKQAFNQLDGSSVDVDMMYKRDDFLYKKSPELDAEIVVLPYKNKDVSMVIILPNEKTGLAAVEQKLVDGTNDYLKDLQTTNVYLQIPKFKIETTLDVKDLFVNLGIKRVFTPTAELNGILSEESGLYISKGIQKAFIEVNERGSEAAAATAFNIVGYSAVFEDKSVHFTADHPFYFAIQYKQTTLFSGSYRSGK